MHRAFLNLVADLADSLATVLAAAMWPAAIVTVAIIFRRPVGRLLRSVRTWRSPAGDVEFRELLEDAAADASSLPQTAPEAGAAGEVTGADSGSGQQSHPGVVEPFDIELHPSLAAGDGEITYYNSSPNAVISDSYYRLLHEVREAARAVGVVVGPPRAIRMFVRALAEAGVVEPEFTSAFVALDRYRMRISFHESTVAEEDAQKFANTAFALRRYVARRAREVTSATQLPIFPSEGSAS